LVSPAYVFVEDYFNRMALANIGVTSSFESLETYQVEYLTLISSVIADINAKKSKKK